MRDGYTIQNDVSKADNYILVSNYTGFNEVHNLGFISMNTFVKGKGYTSIVVWKIKSK